jgi:uncharacterized protein YcnI
MMKRIALAAVAAGALAVAAPAGAHVTLQPKEVPADGFTRLDVRVPTERDDASTTKVRLKFPPGFEFASYEPVEGWTVKVVRAGKRVGEVVIAAAGGAGIAPGQFRDFGLSLRMPDRPGATLTFKALQTYDSGEVVRWIGAPDADEPAPRVKLTEAAGEGGHEANAQPAEPAAAGDGDGGDDDGPSTALVIAALALAALGATAGVAALMTARRAGGA